MNKLDNEEQDFLQLLRQDLAALCCAGAFVSSPEVWGNFIAWLSDATLSNRDYVSPEQMKLAVLRADRVIMVTHLLSQPDDLSLLEND